MMVMMVMMMARGLTAIQQSLCVPKFVITVGPSWASLANALICIVCSKATGKQSHTIKINQKQSKSNQTQSTRNPNTIKSNRRANQTQLKSFKRNLNAINTRSNEVKRNRGYSKRRGRPVLHIWPLGLVTDEMQPCALPESAEHRWQACRHFSQ